MTDKLDELERRVRGDHNARLSRAQTLALITRIRELEDLATQALNYSDLSPKETREGWAILKQGLVLP